MWLLEELGLEYKLETYQRDPSSMLAPPELHNVHPLGKSPVLTILAPGETEPMVLAESGFIVQYLCEHFATGILVPEKWQPGKENRVGGETEAWRRFAYYLHYAEGSLMPLLVLSLILSRLKSPSVPFFIRPLSSMIANKISASFLFPNAVTHLNFLEQQLNNSAGDYLCGDHLTGADILMSFPLLVAQSRFPDLGSWEGGSPQAKHPKVFEYIERLRGLESYRRAENKVKEYEKNGGTL